MSDAAHACVDDSGFTLPSHPDQVLDVYFGENRVFSVAPDKFQMRNGREHLAWPPALHPYLKGRSHLVVREHLSGRILLDEPIQFGGSTNTISVTDRQGRPLAVDKFGGMVRMFTQTDASAARQLVTDVARLTEDVNAFGVVAFLAFGSLLGAIRSGKLIGHDTDSDIAYLSNHDHPADIARESFALERFLVGRGWTISRMRVGLIRAVFEDQGGDLRHVDIFIAIHRGTQLFIDRYLRVELSQSALVPLSTVTLEGVEVLAPADPGALLAATYGPSYLIPDPSFAYRPPRSLRRKTFAWMGNYRIHHAYWVTRYRRARRGPLPAASGFVKWVAKQVPADASIVDVGCGRGGDLVWLAGHGHRVIGVDYVNAAFGRARALAESEDLPVEFRRVSLYDVRKSVALGVQLAGEPTSPILMSRHLIDVLEPEGRMNFWLLARTSLLRGGRLYLRFRTKPRRSEVGEPGFRVLDADVIEDEARARGARVVSRVDERRATVMVLTWS